MSLLLLAFLALYARVGAQEGGALSAPTSSSDAAGYSCDPNACKLPDCLCASPNPPGGLAPADTPQFIVFTADDGVSTYTIDAINSFLGQRKNPNGCKPVFSYYTNTSYNLVTDAYVSGVEIADHTMTHVGSPPQDEVVGNLMALNTLAGIPLSAMQGFRAPFLNYTTDTLKMLKQLGFTYDSSMTSSIPCNQPGTDCVWPYTLDNGVTNDCLSVDGLCKGALKVPGLWEVPMYATFDGSANGIHLMDPWLDAGAMNGTTPAVVNWMQTTFMQHYNGNRQPFGVYAHPIHLATGYPGLSDPTAMIAAVNQFLDWAQQQPNTWIVSSEQLLAWVRQPTPISQLNNFAPLHCTAPNVPTVAKICNGIPQNEAGLLQQCPWTDWSSSSCYGCPATPPQPGNPTPPQISPTSGQTLRYRLPANCSTAFFDPIKNVCSCTDSSCAFSDNTRPISADGTGNFTQGGTGTSSGPQSSSTLYRSFSGTSRLVPSFVVGALAALALLCAV